MKVNKEQLHHQPMGLLPLGPWTASDGTVLFVSVFVKSLFSYLTSMKLETVPH
jgi:hypothetical protein